MCLTMTAQTRVRVTCSVLLFLLKSALVRTISARRLSYLISPLATVEQRGRRAGFSDAGL